MANGRDERRSREARTNRGIRGELDETRASAARTERGIAGERNESSARTARTERGVSGATAEMEARADRADRATEVLRRSTRATRGVLILFFVLGVAVAGQAYRSRADLAEVQRTACQRQVEDRLDTIGVREVQATADAAISRDPFQPAVTRRTRARQAAVEVASVRSERTRVDPAHGGRLDCSREYREPSLLP